MIPGLNIYAVPGVCNVLICAGTWGPLHEDLIRGNVILILPLGADANDASNGLSLSNLEVHRLRCDAVPLAGQFIRDDDLQHVVAWRDVRQLYAANSGDMARIR